MVLCGGLEVGRVNRYVSFQTPRDVYSIKYQIPPLTCVLGG